MLSVLYSGLTAYFKAVYIAPDGALGWRHAPKGVYITGNVVENLD
jgi:hypothetical protein